MKNRNQDFKGTTFMVLSFVVMIGLFGYSHFFGKMDVKTIITGTVFLLFIFAWTTADVVAYRNKYVKPEDMDKTFFRRRRNERKKTEIYKKTITGKDMYDAYNNYAKDRNISQTVILIFIQLMIAGLFLGMTGTAIHWGFYVGIPLVLTSAFYICTCRRSKEVKMLKKFVVNSPYDEMLVNNDFMTGAKHILMNGMICVGMQYVVICHFEGVYVCELTDVVSVEKIVEVIHSGGLADFVTERYAVKIWLKQGDVTVPCMDGIGAELLIEEFKHRGYF